MITREQIMAVSSWVTANPDVQPLDMKLREKFPDLHFTCCMDDDVVSARPVYEHPDFNLYLIDSSNHCLSFTRELDVATGIVVAEIDEE